MLIRNEENYICVTMSRAIFKKQVERLANEVLSWLLAAGILLTLGSVAYYGTMAYNYLTNLF